MAHVIDRIRRRIGAALARYLSQETGGPGSAAPLDPALLVAALRPGDVLLVEGRTRVSVAIKYLTQSTWSHAALYAGAEAGLTDALGRPAAFLEADIHDGVRAVGVAAYAGLNCRICRPMGLDAAEVAAVLGFVRQRLGHRYDMKHVVDLARYLLPTPPVPQRWRRRMLALGSGDPTRAICSTLIAQAFQSVRYPILPRVEELPSLDPGCRGCVDEILHVRHHSLFVPRDFDISPYFAIVKPTLTQGFDHRTLPWSDPLRPGATPAPAPSAAANSPPSTARRSLLRRALAGLGLWTTGRVAAAGFEASNGFDVSQASVPAAAIQRGGPPRDGIPAIDRPRFVPAGKAALADEDRVLGIVRHGLARAYPVRILNWHEVVNDRFGDEVVVVTYCPLCGTGMAFEAPKAAGDGRFGVSGLLYNSDVLLFDRATESLWSQILKTAISGPLRGTRLTPVALAHTSWADWRARHPATEVLSTDTGFVRDYARDPYAGYERVQRLMFDVQHRDDRFPLKEWVLGVEVDGVHKAYPFSRLERILGAGGELRDEVGGRRLRIRYDRAHATAMAFDADGTPWPGTMAFWFAWVAFHPATEVLRLP